MPKINNFDVLKRMCEENMDIRVTPISSALRVKKVTGGMHVTFGVNGDNVLYKMLTGGFGGSLMLVDRKSFDALKEKMEAESQG